MPSEGAPKHKAQFSALPASKPRPAAPGAGSKGAGSRGRDGRKPAKVTSVGRRRRDMGKVRMPQPQVHGRRARHFLVCGHDNMVHIQLHKGRNVTGKATWTSSFRKN